MDCFYAAIEVRDNPTLRGQPVAVGGSRRGVLTTCNYKARKFGLHSAMPTFLARRKCPHVVVVPVRFEVYRRESRRIRSLMAEITHQIEPLSLDEAYLDVSTHGQPPVEIATQLRRRVYRTTGLTASAGIGPNKLIAKIASDWMKPNGQHEVRPDQVAAFMYELPVRRIWGVGHVAAGRLEQLGVKTCGELHALPKWKLQEIFGRFGTELYHLCRGVDDRPVAPHRERKSISNERTFSQNLDTLAACEAQLDRLHHELAEDLRRHAEARRVTSVFVKLKFADFSRTTVARSHCQPDHGLCRKLLAEGFGRSGQSVRLLGIGVRLAEESADEQTQLELPLPLSERPESEH